VPRPREFDERDALDKAMTLFWETGYEAASVADLTAATGLSKSSLYDTFGSKHELMLSALRCYVETITEPSLAVLDEMPSARDAIETRFGMMVDFITAPGVRRGCLLANTTLELGPHDPKAKRILLSAQNTVEDAYERAIRRGQAQGTIGNLRSSRSLARHLMACLAGMICLSKAGAEREALVDIADTAMAVLD
jgi:TetR/AcrR family transcriptional repressor of nem operon